MHSCKTFRLEPSEKNVAKGDPIIFFTKNSYSPRVQITGWEGYQQSLPIDNDPYCPGSVNHFKSHYNRFGYDSDEKLATATQLSLQQISLKPDLDKLFTNTKKYMVNYYTFKNTSACSGFEENDKVCTDLCANDYSTTMQSSYRLPHPYVMENLSSRKTPFLQNRIFEIDDRASESPHTFYDDDYVCKINRAQKVKGFRWVSYDPLTYMNTDGSLPQQRKSKCIDLKTSSA